MAGSKEEVCGSHQVKQPGTCYGQPLSACYPNLLSRGSGVASDWREVEVARHDFLSKKPNFDVQQTPWEKGRYDGCRTIQ